ncbi:hypothetical protein F5B17DRAFT_389742 [Nemania serpens]|nr:hypothetical protein F5B17DRAFT_389742 [Nemania serpens]
MRQPNLLLPPRSSVMQVEHAVEVPQDPRPNAFYDNDSSTMRVYHGPAYGNPYGMLYPKRVYNHQNFPIGVPHPMQNPWYYGFPHANGPPDPPHVLPRGGIDESNPWFQGWGTVGPAPISGAMPPPPDFSATKDKKGPKPDGRRHSPSPPRSHGYKDREAGWNSNVVPIPSVEVTAPEGSPARGSQAGEASGSPWGAQVAPGFKKNPDQQTEKKRKKKAAVASDADNMGAAFNEKLAGLGKALQEAAAKDSADLRVREERWSNRSGSSKEPSPQPNNGWNDNLKNTTNNNNGGEWDTGAGTGNGDGNSWNAGNANAGGDSSWDKAAANSAWDNVGENNSWDNANKISDRWSNIGDNSGWDNTATNNNNGGPSNPNNNGSDNGDWASYQANNDKNNGNTWKPVGFPSSPLPTNATPIPGTWASPVPSNSNKVPSNKGKGKDVESGQGWGDATLAQSSGGYWDTKEGQADMAKGAKDGKGSNGSWW